MVVSTQESMDSAPSAHSVVGVEISPLNSISTMWSIFSISISSFRRLLSRSCPLLWTYKETSKHVGIISNYIRFWKNVSMISILCWLKVVHSLFHKILTSGYFCYRMYWYIENFWGLVNFWLLEVISEVRLVMICNKWFFMFFFKNV